MDWHLLLYQFFEMKYFGETDVGVEQSLVDVDVYLILLIAVIAIVVI